MKIHEFQGKQIFDRFGVKVLENRVAKTPDEAAAAYNELGGKIAVVKSQIHAGGGVVKEHSSKNQNSMACS